MKINLNELTQNDIFLLIERIGQKPYRAKQIIHWIYRNLATSIDEMTDLSRELREELKTIAVISNLILVNRQRSVDGTQKYLLKLEDGETIESVLIPNSRGKNRFTLCISSQVGCSVGCRFCRTGSLGLKRNLKAYEIIGQVIAIMRHISGKQAISLQEDGTAHDTPASERTKDDLKITNIVFMGMGEPLNNYNEVIGALDKITALMGFSKRRVTLSTAGIVPGIRKLAEHRPDINLAISLNATTDEIRNRIMPINKQYSLKKLLKACRDFPLAPNRRITFEYILLDRINDAPDDARRLVKLLKGIKSKVNLIPYNPDQSTAAHKPGNLKTEFRKPPDSRILAFQNTLKKSKITVIIRKSMGADIAAACGQLKAFYQ